jgi:hypothetical protein
MNKINDFFKNNPSKLSKEEIMQHAFEGKKVFDQIMKRLTGLTDEQKFLIGWILSREQAMEDLLYFDLESETEITDDEFMDMVKKHIPDFAVK